MKSVGFSEDQMRVELKRMVEREKSRLLQSLYDVEREAESLMRTDPEMAADAAEQKLQKLREKNEQAGDEASYRFQQIMDFIERR